MLGLDFRFRFCRAVPAGQPIDLDWQVVHVRHKASLRGELVLLAGHVRSAEADAAVKAVGKVLVLDAL
ncbi:MAG TPA: hypothetical protein VFZ65_02800 [Planctomycetota bacterium]|nr:hypothetical protein [Planctomycetota bacterium]